jgi:hypothetical protein
MTWFSWIGIAFGIVFGFVVICCLVFFFMGLPRAIWADLAKLAEWIYKKYHKVNKYEKVVIMPNWMPDPERVELPEKAQEAERKRKHSYIKPQATGDKNNQANEPTPPLPPNPRY